MIFKLEILCICHALNHSLFQIFAGVYENCFGVAFHTKNTFHA